MTVTNSIDLTWPAAGLHSVLPFWGRQSTDVMPVATAQPLTFPPSPPLTWASGCCFLCASLSQCACGPALFHSQPSRHGSALATCPQFRPHGPFCSCLHAACRRSVVPIRGAPTSRICHKRPRPKNQDAASENFPLPCFLLIKKDQGLWEIMLSGY